MTTPNTEKYETWAIVELLGHKQLAGYVSEQTIAGSALVRIDVPATPEDTRWNRTYAATAAYTKLVGVSSIYALTPCDEETARRAAREIERHNDPLPVSLPALTAGTSTEDAEVIRVEDEEDDLPFDEALAPSGGQGGAG